MKLIFLFLALRLSPPESRVDRFPQSHPSYSGCDSREVATAIQSSNKIPRNILFHYGKKELLLKMLKPEATWDDLTKDDNDTYTLKRFRQGLYGTEYAEDADAFGEEVHNWLVEIKLKSECLKPSRVVSLVYLTKNPAFQKWYELKSYPNSWDHWKTSCFDSDAYPRSKSFIDYQKTNELRDWSETQCEKIISDYYEDQKFAFVQDHAGDLARSWAVRDRSCIASIEGSEAYWSKEFATREELWLNTCNRERNHRNNIRVWFQALEKSGIEIKLLEKFSAMVKSIPGPVDRLDWQTQELDRFAAQDFAEPLLAAARRCGSPQANRLQSALGKISKNVDQSSSSDVKMELESLCR